MGKVYVGFGFGPIQSGLFLYEAQRSGNFGRFVVSEVDEAMVRAVRANGGAYALNIARPDRIDACRVTGVELLNPRDPHDRAAIVQALGESDEIASCLPSVQFYQSDSPACVARLLADGLLARAAPGPVAVYASENHNHAAEILRDAVASHAAAGVLDGVQTLNTVIGKMSGVITDPAVIRAKGLVPVTADLPRAILVEEFNRILVSRIDLPGYRRGIEVFQEKPDLLPFEEAKLYGHNAIHALIAYLADRRGLATIADAADDRRIMDTARAAFLEESGLALIARRADTGDALFTPQGWREYAEDLLGRMVNPNLNDLVARVGRDHLRKLAYDDRLYGTMRLCLDAGIEPRRLALGAAAGVVSMVRRRDELDSPPPFLPRRVEDLDPQSLEKLLRGIWGDKADGDADGLVERTADALEELRRAW